MQVQCEYCNSWINDTDEQCPNCGAANSKLTRVAKQTPTTIEELKSWYRARNLPPYETTRFFIGQNYTGPKAFGIYQDGNNFVVYKNKADGSRAIRYKGKDEAYAVNELYLRLKEEILNQKSMNISKRNAAPTRSSEQTYPTERKLTGCRGCLFHLLPTPILICLIAIVALIAFCVVAVIIDSYDAQSNSYYLNEAKTAIYYHEGTGENLSAHHEPWWRTDISNPDWVLIDEETDDHGFPAGVTRDGLCEDSGTYNSMLTAANLWNDSTKDILTSPYNVTNSHAYIDLHHNTPRSNGYYVVNGTSYYYLNDSYGSQYGTRDNSGWYRYEDEAWQYYSSGDDHEAIGDELWYDDDKYRVGSNYYAYDTYISGNAFNFTDEEAAAWSSAAMVSSFEDTTWYGETIAADEAHEQYVSSHSSSSSSDDSFWSSDSSSDWSSSDSWDSGGSDWDSDW